MNRAWKKGSSIKKKKYSKTMHIIERMPRAHFSRVHVQLVRSKSDCVGFSVI